MPITALGSNLTFSLGVCIIISMLTQHRGQCTFDLNSHEIQYVADHLTTEECKDLLTELKRRQLNVNENKVQLEESNLVNGDQHQGDARNYNDEPKIRNVRERRDHHDHDQKEHRSRKRHDNRHIGKKEQPKVVKSRNDGHDGTEQTRQPEKSSITDGASKPFSQPGITNMPRSCFQRLVRWNNQDGKRHTFFGLAESLRHINRPALAAKLSRTVYKQKSDAVIRDFLADPFKKLIHSGSPMLKEAPLVEPPTNYVKSNPWTTYHTISLVISTVLVLVSFVFCIKWCCPGMCGCCDRACGNVRSGYYKHIVGLDVPKLEKKQSQLTRL